MKFNISTSLDPYCASKDIANARTSIPKTYEGGSVSITSITCKDDYTLISDEGESPWWACDMDDTLGIPQWNPQTFPQCIESR